MRTQAARIERGAAPARKQPATNSKRTRPAALARYTAADGRRREIITRRGVRRSTLVIDRVQRTRTDARLLAILTPDEPPENAQYLCREYLAHPRRCRQVNDADLLLSIAPPTTAGTEGDAQPRELIDKDGNRYRISPVGDGDAAPLRWTKTALPGAGRSPCVVSLREVIGALEDYQPALALTEQTLTHGQRAAKLGAELRALRASPTVLNRLLREHVEQAVENGLSLSEIAIRCGHMQPTANGHGRGESSWVRRRVGLACDSGSTPSPWVHTDVLAAIARAIGVDPSDAEL